MFYNRNNVHIVQVFSSYERVTEVVKTQKTQQKGSVFSHQNARERVYILSKNATERVCFVERVYYSTTILKIFGATHHPPPRLMSSNGSRLKFSSEFSGFLILNCWLLTSNFSATGFTSSNSFSISIVSPKPWTNTINMHPDLDTRLQVHLMGLQFLMNNGSRVVFALMFHQLTLSLGRPGGFISSLGVHSG